MLISEFTPDRAEALYKFRIPETESPLKIKTLWIDVLNADDMDVRVLKDSHSHSFFEVHFVFEGAVHYEYNGNFVEVAEGQALLIFPDVSHKYIWCSDDLLKVSLAFSLGEKEQWLTFFENKEYVQFDISHSVADNINYILRQTEKNNIFVPYIISGRVTEIICSVFERAGADIPIMEDTHFDSRADAAKSYIKNNIHRILSCDDVAKECCLSSKQMSRIFRKAVGCSVYEYIIYERIKYAKKLLTKTEKSVKEISFMMGFENESSFVTFFKRHCGLPPGVFRKENTKCP